MKLLIPLKLDVDLNSRGNTRLAAILKTREIATQRQAVSAALNTWKARGTLAHLREKNPSDWWTVVLTRVAPRQLDDDNLAGRLKAVRDQVAQEMGINDRDRQRLLFVAEQRTGEPKQHAVEIEVLPRVDWCAEELFRLSRLNQAASVAHQKALNDAAQKAFLERGKAPPSRLPTPRRARGGGKP